MKLGGLMGILTIPDEAIEAMWPLLWLGQWVHIGKATTFGLGVYRLDQAP
jgi:CRISPR/Cas system endoribonuclease Cas6 (RAMP superfamily)